MRSGPGRAALACAIVTALLHPAETIVAQGGGGQEKSVYVLTFDQLAVDQSAREIFGGEYDLGRGIARLVATRLAEQGIAVTESEGPAAGTVQGTILVFGRAQASGEAGGISVSRLRVGIGRRQERAAVHLEARLIDRASGQLLTMASGTGESDRGGWNAFARLRGGPDLANMDLSGEQFRETAIGDATHQAVNQLVEALRASVPDLGTLVAPEPEEPAPAEPAPAVLPVAPAGEPVAAPVGPVGSFAWAPYQFRGTEHFRYDVRRVEDGQSDAGYYQLDFEPAGQGRVRMRVQGQVGDEEYSSTVTTNVGPQGMQLGMSEMMALGPIGMMLLNPVSSMMFTGRELTAGDEWTWGGGGESVSIKVEGGCQAAGQSGLQVVFRDSGVVRQESCVANGVALPVRLMVNDDDMRMEMTLREYRP